MKFIKITTLAKTPPSRRSPAPWHSDWPAEADAASGTMYGDPAAAAKWWRHQQYDDCVLMSTADVVGQMTGKEPSERAIIRSRPIHAQHQPPRLDLHEAGLQEGPELGHGHQLRGRPGSCWRTTASTPSGRRDKDDARQDRHPGGHRGHSSSFWAVATR